MQERKSYSANSAWPASGSYGQSSDPAVPSSATASLLLICTAKLRYRRTSIPASLDTALTNSSNAGGNLTDARRDDANIYRVNTRKSPARGRALAIRGQVLIAVPESTTPGMLAISNNPPPPFTTVNLYVPVPPLLKFTVAEPVQSLESV